MNNQEVPKQILDKISENRNRRQRVLSKLKDARDLKPSDTIVTA